MTRLSIIIPVYNASTTIKRCLDSIWAAGIPDDEIEVICVDDCSTDDSCSVIESMQCHHPNLRLLRNTTNLRAGGARNHGIRMAEGEYACFIDSDDYYEPSSLQKAHKSLRGGVLDILFCDSAREIGGKPSYNLVHNISDTAMQSGISFLLKNPIPLAPWKYIFKKEMMIANGIYFEEKVTAEDGDWVLRMTLKAKSMMYMPLLLVHYVLMTGSVTASVSFKSALDVLFEVKRINEITERESDSRLVERIRAIRNGQAMDAIRRYMQCYAGIAKKTTALKNNLVGTGYRGMLAFAQKHPYAFSAASNLAMPFVITLLRLKRLAKGRM